MWYTVYCTIRRETLGVLRFVVCSPSPGASILPPTPTALENPFKLPTPAKPQIVDGSRYKSILSTFPPFSLSLSLSSRHCFCSNLVCAQNHSPAGVHKQSPGEEACHLPNGSPASLSTSPRLSRNTNDTSTTPRDDRPLRLRGEWQQQRRRRQR